MFRPPKENIKQLIERELSSLQIYEFYLNKKINSLPITIKSPFRKEKRPSFGIFNINGNILWKDFALKEGGDIYKLISVLYNISYYEAIEKIKKEMIDKVINCHTKIQCDNIIKKSTFNSNKILYSPFSIAPKSYYDYWNNYLVIDDNILKKNNVKAVKHIVINTDVLIPYNEDNIIIAYNWFYNNIHYFKIYMPYNSDMKWRTNFTNKGSYIIHGLDIIDKTENYIIITKSVKDTMCLQGLGFNAINVQSEGITILKEHMDLLKLYYKKIFLLYDNDFDKIKNWGQLAAEKTILEHPELINICIPTDYLSKDISDLLKNIKNIKEVKKITNKLIK